MHVYYKILGADKEAQDAELRQKYLELIQIFSPEKEPEKFKILTTAYEAVKDRRSRIKTSLYGTAKQAECIELLTAMKLSGTIQKKRPVLSDLMDKNH